MTADSIDRNLHEVLPGTDENRIVEVRTPLLEQFEVFSSIPMVVGEHVELFDIQLQIGQRATKAIRVPDATKRDQRSVSQLIEGELFSSGIAQHVGR